MNAAIFRAHQLLLADEELLNAIFRMISTQKVNAEYAVEAVRDNYCAMFLAMEDEYMSARAADIQDISGRVLSILSGNQKPSSILSIEEPVIILADDLSPGETILLDKDKVLAFVTTGGSANSHTAILARTYGIPALVGAAIRQETVPQSESAVLPEPVAQPGTEVLPESAAQLKQETQPGYADRLVSLHGQVAVVNGDDGFLYIDPDEETLQSMRARQEAAKAKKRLLSELKGKESITPDGRKITICANVGNSGDLPLVLENDAEGIGLFRSEFLYLGKDTFPTEEEQFEVYKNVAQTMAGKLVIIRTLDIGADKQVSYMQLAKEENPAMGLRAIRICLTRPQIFKTQLRALYRASAYGNIAIMYPMITSVKEIKQIKALTEEVKAELAAEGIEYKNIAQGIMIETPAAVMISDLLAQEADFFSIGTNDLTQYTLAIDRQNQTLESFYDPYHPAVLRMIAQTVENAHRVGIRCGICGELGADTGLTEWFLELGMDELSVSPGSVLMVRKAVREAGMEEKVCRIKISKSS